MAQDNWLNVTVDANIASGDPTRAKHGVSGGTAAAGDVTFSFDHTKLTTLNAADSIWAAVRLRLIAGGLK